MMRAHKKALFIALILLITILQHPLAIIPQVKADSKSWETEHVWDNVFKYSGIGGYKRDTETGVIGYHTNPGYLICDSWFRWNNLTIPKNSNIVSAYFKVYSYSSGGTSLTKIWGIDEDNAINFELDPSARDLTSASQDWDTVPSPGIQTSPDIKDVIQEIIDRPGWASGNSLAIKWGDDGSSQSEDNFVAIEVYNDINERWPILEVTWTPPAEAFIENEEIVASDSTVDDEQWFFLNASVEVQLNTTTFLFNRIDIDPAGLNLSCSYTNATDTFVEENDPNDYLQLDVAVSLKTNINSTFVRLDYYLRIHPTVTKEGLYNITVYSTASGGLNDTDAYISVFTLTIRTPSAPTLLFGAGFNASSPYVEIYWTHNLLIFNHFEVQNSSNKADWDYLGQNTTTQYTDSQVMNGTERYYKVRACRSTGVGWKNTSFTDVNFETVYFIIPIGEISPGIGDGCAVVDNYINETRVAGKHLIVRNTTYDAMELKYTAGGVEGDYIDSWDTSGQSGDSLGIATDGTNIWITDYVDDEVYKYTMAGEYVDSWNTLVQGGWVSGITTDGNFIWTTDFTDDEVNKYTMAGVYVSRFPVNIQSDQPRGLTTDGNFIWVVDYEDDNVYRYEMDGTYLDSFDISGEGGNTNGITTDGTNIWTVDWNEDEVYKYTMAGVYVGSWDTSGHGTAQNGITTDGINFWIVCPNTDEVYKYDFGLAGYIDSGHFYTTDLLSGIDYTGQAVLLNTTLPSGDTLTVEFSQDNSSWILNDWEPIFGGYEAIDIRNLSYSTLYLRFNFTDGGVDSTPRLYQVKIYHGAPCDGNGVAVNFPAILAITFNTTLADAGCGIYGQFSDVEGLDGYIFWNNATSAPGGVNSSFTGLAGVSDATQEDVTLPSSGIKFGVKYYVNDTDGNWGVDTLVMYPALSPESINVFTGSSGIFGILLCIIVPIVAFMMKRR